MRTANLNLSGVVFDATITISDPVDAKFDKKTEAKLNSFVHFCEKTNSHTESLSVIVGNPKETFWERHFYKLCDGFLVDIGPKLKCLHIKSVAQVAAYLDFRPLASFCPNLETLRLESPNSLHGFHIDQFKLKHLSIHDRKTIFKLDEIDFSRMETFKTYGLICLMDISKLKTAKHLTTLELNAYNPHAKSHCSLDDLSVLNSLTNLRGLSLQEYSLQSIDFASFPSLKMFAYTPNSVLRSVHIFSKNFKNIFFQM